MKTDYKKKNQPLLLYAVVLLLVIFGSLLYFIVTKNLLRPIPSPKPEDALQATTASKIQLGQSTIEAISLPLTIVKTSVGVAEGEGGGPLPTRITIPKTVSANIPTGYANLVEAYAIAEYNTLGPIVLGPKGWVGVGSIGANGNTILTIKPGNTNKKGSVTYEEIAACDACFYWAAGPYFSQVAEIAKSNPLWKVDPIPQLKTVPISPQLVSYSLPNTKEGLEVNGVAYAKKTKGMLGNPFIKLEVFLPPGQHELSTVILNYFTENLPKN
jgi:Domain of unknown function (DUF4850)